MYKQNTDSGSLNQASVTKAVGIEQGTGFFKAVCGL